MTHKHISPSITHLSSLPPPVGGVSVFVERLHRKLLSSGVVSHVAVPSSWKGPLPDGVSRRPGFPGRLAHLDPLLNAVLPFPTNIVHCHEGYRENAPVLLALKARQKKLVLTVHSTLHCGDLTLLHPWQRYSAHRVLEDPTVYWVAVNEQIRGTLLDQGARGPVVVAPAYIPAVPGTRVLSEDVIRFMGAHEPLILVYGFRFNRLKNEDLYGFENAIRMLGTIVGDYPKAGLVLLCPDPSTGNGGEALRDLRRVSAELGVADSICWILEPLESLDSILAHCTLYVRPTLTDGDSVLVREALAKGIPVVASDVVHRPEGVETYSISEDGDGLVRAAKSALARNHRPDVEQPDIFKLMLGIYNEVLSN